MRFSFIVLHYKAVESTMKCINSILDFNSSNNIYDIIVIDNGSGDGTAEKLQKEYNTKIHMIKLDKGIGFSRANNLGYKYAIEKYNPDFIVMTNNDIVFNEKSFMDKIVKINEVNDFDLLGPDIINPDGSHGNPYADRPRNIEEIKDYIKRAKIKKRLGIIYILLKDLLNHKKEIKVQEVKQTEQKNVCLWGACIIFSKKFIDKNEKAFCPETMFYCEEDILCHRVIRDGGYILYSPDITVYHGHSDSTKAAFKSRLSRNKFCFTNDIESGRIYLNMLLEEKKKI